MPRPKSPVRREFFSFSVLAVHAHQGDFLPKVYPSPATPWLDVLSSKARQCYVHLLKRWQR